ncbi:MAG: hypothetical protein JSR58_02770 [Verrucomicrobia bacterium]|nr:hypothetical protein [Verrucomicrobiota bacterium]
MLFFGMTHSDAAPPPKKIDVLDSFYPELKNGDNMWINADLLYFLTSEKRIAMTNKKTDLFTTADVTEKPMVHPDFPWDLGFRLGFGYIFPQRDWDITANWTYFHTSFHQKRSTHGNVEFGMFPVWSLADDILPFDWVSEAKMDFDLHLNYVDIDGGRAFKWGSFFLRPFAGIRVAWIKQEIDVAYKGGIFANGLNLPGLGSDCRADHVDMRNNFFGIGPQVGIEPQINLGKGWRLYGNACGSIEYGFFNVREHEVYLETLRYYRHKHPQRWRWMLDAGAGVLWKTFIAHRRFALTFKAGWEYHVFYDQVELKGDEFDLVSDDRNLILNGVALSTRFDF